LIIWYKIIQYYAKCHFLIKFYLFAEEESRSTSVDLSYFRLEYCHMGLGFQNRINYFEFYLFDFLVLASSKVKSSVQISNFILVLSPSKKTILLFIMEQLDCSKTYQYFLLIESTPIFTFLAKPTSVYCTQLSKRRTIFFFKHTRKYLYS
jgi:hypothetical protein